MSVFRPLPSSGRLCARRNASSRKTLTSSFCSSTLFLSKILPSSLSAFAVSLLRAEMSCVGFSLMSIVPGATAVFVVLSALPCTTVGIEGVECSVCTTFRLSLPVERITALCEADGIDIADEEDETQFSR